MTNNDTLREEFNQYTEEDNAGLSTLSRMGTDLIANYWLSKLASLKAEIKQEIAGKKRQPIIELAHDIARSEEYNQALEDIINLELLK